jgi:hypothetical protein
MKLTQKRLRELLDYDPETGVFKWRISYGYKRSGAIAGCFNFQGYWRISVDGQRYQAHRLVWLYVHGKFPDKELDHVSGQRSDNRLINLREATRAENCRNRKIGIDNKSGFKGVSWHKKTKKWAAHAQKRYLGVYPTKEEASAAYEAASTRLFGEFKRAC